MYVFCFFQIVSTTMSDQDSVPSSSPDSNTQVQPRRKKPRYDINRDYYMKGRLGLPMRHWKRYEKHLREQQEWDQMSAHDRSQLDDATRTRKRLEKRQQRARKRAEKIMRQAGLHVDEYPSPTYTDAAFLCVQCRRSSICTMHRRGTSCNCRC